MTSAALRLLIVIPELHRQGGTERVVTEEMVRFPPAWSITLLTSRCAVLLRDDIRIVRLLVVPFPGILQYLSFYFLSSLWILWQTLRGNHFDVVFSPGINCAQVDVSMSHYARKFYQF